MTQITHEQCITFAKQLQYHMTELVEESPVGLWDEQLGQLKDLIAEMEITYQRRLEDLPGEDSYRSHNTMSHAIQGTKARM